MDLIGWVMAAFAALAAINAYRHTSRELPATYWGGASAAGQACLSGGCIAIVATSQFSPGGPSALRWAVVVLGVAIWWLGLHIEKRAASEAAQRAFAADGAARHGGASSEHFTSMKEDGTT